MSYLASLLLHYLSHFLYLTLSWLLLFHRFRFSLFLAFFFVSPFPFLMFSYSALFPLLFPLLHFFSCHFSDEALPFLIFHHDISFFVTAFSLLSFFYNFLLLLLLFLFSITGHYLLFYDFATVFLTCHQSFSITSYPLLVSNYYSFTSTSVPPSIFNYLFQTPFSCFLLHSCTPTLEF